MAKDKLTEYDATAANNTVVGDVNLAENSCLPSDLNNAVREVMSHLKEFAEGTNGINVLSLADDDASASIKFQAPSAVTATVTFTLPDGDGESGQTLVTNGSGTLAWHAPYGNRNLVINGSFAISQRGTSFSAPNGTYTLDRMRCAQANSADTISQQTFTAGQTDVPGSPKNFLRFAFGAATANRVLETRIEDVYTSAGQSITLSFYAKASSAHTSSIELTQIFGSGGSSAVAFGTQNYDITTSFQRFEFTLSCPSISGKTIGAGSYLSAAFIRSLSAGPSINVDIALLQLEVGSVATPFEHRSFADELARCQRYFAELPSFSGPGTGTTDVRGMGSHPVQMRAAPTLGTTGVLNITDGYTYDRIQSSASVALIANSPDFSFFNMPNFSSITGGRIHFGPRDGNNTNRVTLDAEL